ncbi:MAG: stage II sporulation protein R [Bacillota bacterium]
MRARIAVSVFILLITVIAILASAAMFDARLFPREVGAPKAFNTHNLIRLHVVANSDSEEDQSLKLDVRDAVVARTKELLGTVRTKEEAWRVLLESIGEIQAVATNEIRRAGRTYQALVEMGTFAFPERKYGGLTLPGGDYEAVRVVLGAGKGRNWWCVLFPPLCFIRMNESREVEGLKYELSPGEALARLRLNLAGPPSPQARRTPGTSEYVPLSPVFGASRPRPLSCSATPAIMCFSVPCLPNPARPSLSSPLSLGNLARDLNPHTAARIGQTAVL